jgi:hypothetical protein
MIEIETDICRYDGELESDEIPLILVHPWYGGGSRFKIFRTNEPPRLPLRKKSYPENLSALLCESLDRNVFLFEEDPLVEETLKRINDISGKKRGLYAIGTQRATSTPKEATWSNVVRFMKEFSDEMEVAGGYVMERSDQPDRDYAGCAGRVYHELQMREVKPRFVEGCCFTW